MDDETAVLLDQNNRPKSRDTAKAPAAAPGLWGLVWGRAGPTQLTLLPCWTIAALGMFLLLAATASLIHPWPQDPSSQSEDNSRYIDHIIFPSVPALYIAVALLNLLSILETLARHRVFFGSLYDALLTPISKRVLAFILAIFNIFMVNDSGLCTGSDREAMSNFLYLLLVFRFLHAMYQQLQGGKKHMISPVYQFEYIIAFLCFGFGVQFYEYFAFELALLLCGLVVCVLGIRLTVKMTFTPRSDLSDENAVLERSRLQNPFKQKHWVGNVHMWVNFLCLGLVVTTSIIRFVLDVIALAGHSVPCQIYSSNITTATVETVAVDPTGYGIQYIWIVILPQCVITLYEAFRFHPVDEIDLLLLYNMLKFDGSNVRILPHSKINIRLQDQRPNSARQNSLLASMPFSHPEPTTGESFKLSLTNCKARGRDRLMWKGTFGSMPVAITADRRPFNYVFKQSPEEYWRNQRKFVHQIYMYLRCPHPNLASFIGFCYYPCDIHNCEFIATCVCEYLPCSLNSFLFANRFVLSDVTKLRLLNDIASFLDCFHSDGEIHGDISATNIRVCLMNGIPVAKAIDFSSLSPDGLNNNRASFDVFGVEARTNLTAFRRELFAFGVVVCFIDLFPTNCEGVSCGHCFYNQFALRVNSAQQAHQDLLGSAQFPSIIDALFQPSDQLVLNTDRQTVFEQCVDWINVPRLEAAAVAEDLRVLLHRAMSVPSSRQEVQFTITEDELCANCAHQPQQQIF